MSKKLTTEDFIRMAKETHGDKYDYSKVNYVNCETEVCIICPEHGEFWQRPNVHIKGHKCPYCSGVAKLTTEEFIRRAKEVHGNKYDYSKTKYTNAKTPVIIICPEHGEFTQLPHNHLKGKGCKDCKGGIELTTEEFIRRAKETYGDKYDYSKVKYVNYRTPVSIICPIHGEFEKAPVYFIGNRGRGCKKCFHDTLRMSTEEFIRRAKEIHGDKYDYSKVNYVDYATNVCVICPEHGEFLQTPANHLRGENCPTCTRPSYVLKENKLKLLKEFDLENMSSHQLLELISVNALPSEFKKLAYHDGSSEKRKNTIKELIKLYENKDLTEDEVTEILNNEIKEEEEKYDKEHSKNSDSTPTDQKIEKNTATDATTMDEDVLPKADDKLTNELVGYDMFSKQLVSYGEKNKFLSQVEIQKIWNEVLKEDSDNSKNLIEKLLNLRETSSEWLSYVIDEFFKEYERVISITADSEYMFEYAPSLMQKLMVYKMIENNSYLNLCGTGAGKTNAFLMSSRIIGAKHSVIICPNSVVDTWDESIKAIYPNSTIVQYQDIDDLKYLDKCNYSYIIINYDKFSSGSLSTKDKMDEFIDKIKPQFICFDEVHNAKVRDEDASIRNANLVYFRKYSNDVYGNDFKVLGMTATPLINNLKEVRSLLELITGNEFAEIGNRNTIENIHLAYKNLLLHGFRYVPDYSINTINTDIKVDGSHLKEQLISLKNGDINTIEGVFVNDKMESIKSDLTPGTIVYTTFIDKIVTKIEKKLREFGIKFARYTGKETAKERSEILKSFGRKEFDVLVASSPITTGVDGLQKFCNKIVMISLPWTNAEYTQLIGRINRQGSVFDEINIIFPHIDIEIDNGKVWSWDNKRKNIIVKKKTLSDAVVDGVFSYTANIDRGKLLKGAIEALKNGEATEDFELNRKEISADPKIDITSREYSESIINETHRRANTEKSSTTHKRFIENPDEWYKYHEARTENMKDWPEIPYEYIASKIKNKNRVVADFGCGNNLMKTCIPNNKVYSFDHLPAKDENGNIDETVIVCDMAHTELENESIDIAVFSLALWGTNYEDYFKEAYRVLNYDGLMYVAEPSAAYDATKRDELMKMIKKNGFTPVGDIEDRGKFFYITVMKK